VHVGSPLVDGRRFRTLDRLRLGGGCRLCNYRVCNYRRCNWMLLGDARFGEAGAQLVGR
jgi:hypothetical protein